MCLPKPNSTLGWKARLNVCFCVLELINGILEEAIHNMTSRMIGCHMQQWNEYRARHVNCIKRGNADTLMSTVG